MRQTLKGEVLAALTACRSGGLTTKEILAQCPLTRAACMTAQVKAELKGFQAPWKTPLETVLWALKADGLVVKGLMRDRCRVWMCVR